VTNQTQGEVEQHGHLQAHKKGDCRSLRELLSKANDKIDRPRLLFDVGISFDVSAEAMLLDDLSLVSFCVATQRSGCFTRTVQVEYLTMLSPEALERLGPCRTKMLGGIKCLNNVEDTLGLRESDV
jgi:hypothetical protein